MSDIVHGGSALESAVGSAVVAVCLALCKYLKKGLSMGSYTLSVSDLILYLVIRSSVK